MCLHTEQMSEEMYFLRQLKKCNVSNNILMLFCRAVVESTLVFELLNWYVGLSVKDRKKLERIVFVAGKIIGSSPPSLEQLYMERTIHKAQTIMGDESHPMNHLFQLLPSGKRFSSAYARTERYKRTFLHSAVSLYTSR